MTKLIYSQGTNMIHYLQNDNLTFHSTRDISKEYVVNRTCLFKLAVKVDLIQLLTLKLMLFLIAFGNETIPNDPCCLFKSLYFQNNRTACFCRTAYQFVRSELVESLVLIACNSHRNSLSPTQLREIRILMLLYKKGRKLKYLYVLSFCSSLKA